MRPKPFPKGPKDPIIRYFFGIIGFLCGGSIRITIRGIMGFCIGLRGPNN